MTPALARFARALRREGLRASPAELLDASRAVESVGLEDRRRFRAALRTTLAKGRRSQEKFDRVFDRYFAPPALARNQGKGRREGPSPGKRSSPREPEEDPGPVRKLIRQSRKGPTAREGRFRRAVTERHLDADRDRRERGENTDPVRREIRSAETAAQERLLAEQIPRIIRSIRLRTGRRFRKTSRGRPWPQRVFRENLGHDGVPFVLPYRRPRLRKSRVVLLVDVSWSTAAAAGYFLWIATSFLAPGRQARILAFVDRPVDVTASLDAWRSGRATGGTEPRRRFPGKGIVPAGTSFATFLDAQRALDLNAPSDYGRVFYDLPRAGPRLSGRDTVLVVLGDGRTNRFDPLPWAFEEIGRHCRFVLWLVPEPVRRWGTGDSALPVYLPRVDLAVEAWNLSGLAGGVMELLRRL